MIDTPLLQYGANHNYHWFKDALSNGPLEQFRHLGELIKLNKYQPDKEEYISLHVWSMSSPVMIVMAIILASSTK
jgi:hypothetical protein